MVVVATCHGVPALGKVDQVLIIDGEVVILQYEITSIRVYHPFKCIQSFRT